MRASLICARAANRADAAAAGSMSGSRAISTPARFSAPRHGHSGGAQEPHAGRPANQQDAAGSPFLPGQVGGQDAELTAPADERDTRRDGGHGSSIAQACGPGFSAVVQ